MSRYESFISDTKLALEFKSVESAVSWWEHYKQKFPDRIAQVLEYADIDTLSIRQRKYSYKLREKLTI